MIVRTRKESTTAPSEQWTPLAFAGPLSKDAQSEQWTPLAFTGSLSKDSAKQIDSYLNKTIARYLLTKIVSLKTQSKYHPDDLS